MDNNLRPLRITRKVLSGFPRSQHRPNLLTIGTEIPIVNSTPKPRWNFKKANWKKFARMGDEKLRWISPVCSN